MIDVRMALALDASGLQLPDHGDIAVFNPPIEASLTSLPRERTTIIEGFKPFHDDWIQRGFHCQVEAETGYSLVVVCLPRAKNEARALIAQAMSITDGPVVVDGQKTDGVDSILKEMRKRVTLSAPVSKAHGKLFLCAEPDRQAFVDWCAGPMLTEGGFWTAPGVFSADAVDPASALLASVLPEDIEGVVGDFGAGWGYLSAHVLTREAVSKVHLVEAHHMALECARRNVTDARAEFHWADATQWSAPEKLDVIVMNPPFHTSRRADPELGQAFVCAAAAAMLPGGQLWMVANRHLPYEQSLASNFSNVFEIGSDTRFKLFQATRPRRRMQH